MSKSLTIIVVALIVLGVGGYFLYQNLKTSTPSAPADVPRNPSGIVNPEVEAPNYKLYSKTEYQQALADKKVVLLYFTANWCPICAEQEPINMETLKSLESDNQIIAFRVHILDSETTKENEGFASEFEVSYQHTTIIIGPNGEVFYKFTGPLTAENLKEKLLAAKEVR